MTEEISEEQKIYLKEKLDKLIPIFAQASIGNFSQDVPIPDEEDEFAEVYAGIQVMLDVIRNKIRTLEEEMSTRAQIQADLLKKEERFRALIEKSFDAIILHDAQGKILYVSPSFTKILGFSSEEILGTIGFTIVYPDDVKRATEFIAEIVKKTGQSATIELRCKHKDGSLRYLEVTSSNLIDNPNIGAIVSNIHDVTERTIVQETLAKEKAEYEAILASVGDGLIVTDKEGKVEFLSRVAENTLGWTTKDLVDKPLITVVQMEDENIQSIPPHERPLSRALSSGEKVSGTYYYQRQDSTKFPAAVIVTPLIISGKIVGAIEVFRDVTRETELDRAKDEFISLASHELRTPMTAIKGLISMILHGNYGAINDGLKKPLENINLSSERQIHLINDLLDVSRLQTGKINYHLVNFALKQVLIEVAESLQPLVQQKNIALVCKDIQDTLVQADVDWVKQVMSNLIGNAVKFTEKGEISISTRTEQDFALVVVVDTGVGIDPADQDKLFERFRQLRSPVSKKYVGSGLGLYISREVARKMGGDLRLEKSASGEGSTFVFTIPRADTPYAKKVKDEVQKEVQIAFDDKKE